MFSFEGDYKRKPVQALGGSSRNESRDTLLQRTQEDRRKRELLKKQQNSSIKIQSFFRSAQARHEVKQQERGLFDVFYQQFQKTGKVDASGQLVSDMAILARLTRQFLFFYNPRVDNDRMTGLCQLIVRLQINVVKSIALNDETAVYQMKRLLQICCRLLGKGDALAGSVAIPLRMLEIFTDLDIYRRYAGTSFPINVIQSILQHLIRNGYYHSMRALMDSKVPASIERPESLMSSQTSIAGTLLQLIHRPIALLGNAEYDTASKSVMLQSLCSEMFCRPHTEAISRLLIPDLVNGKVPFPFNSFLLALCPSSHLREIGVEKMDRSDWSLTVHSSVWLLYSVLRLSENQLDRLSNDDMLVFLIILHKLVPHLRVRKRKSAFDDDFSDTDEETMDVEQESETLDVCQECLKILESQPIANCLLLLSQRNDLRTLTALCTLCHTLMEEDCMEIHKTRLLYSLAFNSQFLHNLWSACLNISTQSNNGFQSTLLQMLSRGLSMSTFDLNRIVPMLSIFCSHFSHFMMSLHDSEFHGDSSNSKNSMPFTLDKLPHIAQMLCDACLGIIELTHPDTKPVIGAHHNIVSADDLNQQQEMLMAVFKVIVKLVKQLYDRDCRRRFCPEGHWLSSRVPIQLDKLYIPNSNVFVRRPFGTQSILNPRRTLDDDTPLLSNTDVRRHVVLSEMPFVVPFEERVRVFHRLVYQDKQESQGSNHVFGMGHSISILIRRSHLYEDAFEKLSSENEPNLKKKMQVQLVNFAGLDEVGIDGGGIFREFMSELIKTAFDPNRGFFKCTSDKLLYPNPQAKLLVDNFASHYYFLGRILGKVIYDNMLTEMPFASFFLSKLLSRHRGDVDIHHLASLDPEMYKHLLSLKDYEGDISDLGLDFTVVNNELGEAQVEELKPGGKDILVTNHNHIEYIHLMADYRLNKQMRQHCSAFRSGLADVINIDWLRMFDHNELQLVISGAQTPIDLNDLKQNTNYSGGYGPEHPVIVKFWRVVENFTDKQKRQLLKFATSCSRPPLLGFKELYPAFCIHYAGSEPDRLPTASTCMNLLKLPEFQSEETLCQKLLYAIESGSGFELS